MDRRSLTGTILRCQMMWAGPLVWMEAKMLQKYGKECRPHLRWEDCIVRKEEAKGQVEGKSWRERAGGKELEGKSWRERPGGKELERKSWSERAGDREA